MRNLTRPVTTYAICLDQSAERITDPVCRMRLDPANASAWLRHDDHDYWFCSHECIVAFAADPDVYVQAT